MTEFVVPVVDLVSLDRRPERRRRALARLEQVDLPVRIFPAVDLKPGWRGCRASHLHLWDRAVQTNRTLFVMEDDVTFAPDFRRSFAAVLADLPEDWDVLFLGGFEREAIGPVTSRLARSGQVMYTHAYLARPQALRRSLELVRDFDVQIDRAWAARMGELNVYRATPWLTGQEDGWSDTGHAPAVGRDVVPMNEHKEARCRTPHGSV